MKSTVHVAYSLSLPGYGIIETVKIIHTSVKSVINGRKSNEVPRKENKDKHS